MEFLCVGQSKIKAVLSKDECVAYGIRADVGEPTDRQVRSCIVEILKEAERRVGFRVESEKLLVQLYPSVAGGCDVFITKLSNLGERERRAIADADNLLTYEGRDAFFVFDRLASLVRAAKSIADPEMHCDVYHANSGEYYIRVREHSLGGLSDVDLLSEFGARVPALPLGIVGEWGSVIARADGFKLLSRL